MKEWHPVFRRARRSLFLLAGALLLGLSLFFGSAHLRNQLTADLGQKQSQLAAEQEQLAGKQKDLANIQSHLQEFRRLERQGMIGAARRENWVEQLMATRQELELPDTLSYTLKPPAPANTGTEQPPAGEESPPNAEAPLAHPLEFELRQIHEEELLALLKNYQNKESGRFRIQSCRLSEPGASGLSAQCTLRFFTLPKKTAGATP